MPSIQLQTKSPSRTLAPARARAGLCATAVAAACALAAIGTAAAPAQATERLGQATVTVRSDSFGPRVVTVGVDGVVTWNFPGTAGRTSTSDQGFWGSDPTKAGESYSQVFTSAGRFAYHSRSGPDMHGAVEVPVSETGSAQHGYELRWSTIPGGRRTTFDVQVRQASGSWHTLRNHTKDDGTSFDPGQAGNYQIRARTDHGSSTTHRSGWSPAITLTIS